MDLRSVTGGTMRVVFETVKHEHVLPASEHQVVDGEVCYKHKQKPDLKAAAALLFGGQVEVSSDGQTLQPARRRSRASPSVQVQNGAPGAKGLRTKHPFPLLAQLTGLQAEAAAHGESDYTSADEDGPSTGAGTFGAPLGGGPSQLSLLAAGGGPPLLPGRTERPTLHSGLKGTVLAAGPSGSSPAASMPHLAWPAGTTGTGDVNTLIQLEMLRMLRRMRQDGDSSGDDERAKGKGENYRALRGVHRQRNRYEKHPTRVVSDFVSRMQLELGITSQTQFWRVSDYSRRVQSQFGRLRGLLRCHFAAAEALQEYLTGRPDHMAAQVALLMQALHQVALDAGAWDNAQMILVHPDPLTRPEFGAGPEIMSEIAAYRKAIAELQKKQTLGRKEQDGDEAETAEAPRGGGRKKK